MWPLLAEVDVEERRHNFLRATLRTVLSNSYHTFAVAHDQLVNDSVIGTVFWYHREHITWYTYGHI